MVRWGIRLSTARWAATLAILMILQALPVRGEEEAKPEPDKYLTSQQVRDLVPHVLQLHLLRPELDAEHMRRLMKKFLEHLDPSRTAYIQSEVDARTKLNDADLVGLANDIRQGRIIRVGSVNEINIHSVL
jgi:hypothetical protein